MFILRDVPKYEALQEHAKRFPDLDPKATEAWLVLLYAMSAVEAARDRHFAGYGISPGRFSVLALLLMSPREGLTPSELADKCSVTRATMTGLLDGLENAGLVRREEHPDDRRALTITLTAKGRRFTDATFPHHFRWVSSVMSRLSEAEMKKLASLLMKVRAGLEEDAGAAAG